MAKLVIPISNNILRIVPAGGVATNDTATPLIVSAFAFAPSSYGSPNLTFRAVVSTGNNAVTCHVKLRDITTGVDIVDFSVTNQTTEAKVEQVLTTGTPGTNVISTAEKVYEVSIYVDSPTIPTDLVQLYSAEIRVS